jgi:hypothetical protein
MTWTDVGEIALKEGEAFSVAVDVVVDRSCSAVDDDDSEVVVVVQKLKEVLKTEQGEKEYQEYSWLPKEQEESDLQEWK